MATRVTVLGTGIMGSAMARQLLAADHDVTVWNRTREKAEAVGDDGATVADDPADAVDGAELVLTVLADAEAVEEVMTEALGAMADDAVWVQMSTVGLAIDHLADLAAEHAVGFVDAPVLGTKEPAERGEVVVLASGPEDLRERCEPVFDAVGSRTLWLGEAGAASRVKLVTNAWLLGLVEALAESLALAEQLGVDPQGFFDAIEGGPVDATYAGLKGRAMLERDFPASFPLGLAWKDARLVVEAGDEHGLDLPVARVVAGQFARAVAARHGDADMAAVFRVVATDEGGGASNGG
ncbi:MAG: NAD(P)-dependent oxidoreductase [Actinomycetota bacterium]|nr:NAD(P)-dependent oxidoreductase [Actinomycetota bacterium]